MQKEAEGDSGDTVTNGTFQRRGGTGGAPGMGWGSARGPR